MIAPSVSDLYKLHLEELTRRSLAGDEFATKTICCMALLCEGWRHGDPDPSDPPDDDPDGGEEIPEIIMLDAYRKAA